MKVTVNKTQGLILDKLICRWLNQQSALLNFQRRFDTDDNESYEQTVRAVKQMEKLLEELRGQDE